MIHREWKVRNVDESQVLSLKEALGSVRDSLCRLLVSRGIDSYDKAKTFFNPSLSQLHNPWLMKDMDRAVSRITNAIQNGESILIFGDYDVDGTTSVAMMYRFLSSVYNSEKLFYYIPDRYKEGYGLSRTGIDDAVSKGISLIIAVDCGITSAQLIAEVRKESEIDFIICDHHVPPIELPEVSAILNPKQKDCDYPFKELCGCGVCFKLLQAMSEKMQLPPDAYLEFIDLVALATTADIVPVLDENRILCHFGLKKINDHPCEGIKALKKASDAKGQLLLRDLGFGIGPMINAAGRMEHGSIAVELFTADEPQKAKVLADKLAELNNIRKTLDKEVHSEAIKIVEQQGLTHAMSTTVVYKESWHKGVLGIAASRLVETYYRPTIVLAKGEKYISGSARSIPGFNIYDAIQSCREHLIQFGGHTAAAGLTLKPGSLDAFSDQFDKIVQSTLPDELSKPYINIDTTLNIEEVDYPFYKTLKRMEPFGFRNPAPVFLSKGIKIHPSMRIVAQEHVRYVIQINDRRMIAGIGFDQKEKFRRINQAFPVDIVYHITENIWNGQKSLQLKIIDIRQSPAKNESQKIL